jgi:hypothetical protein
MTRLDIRDLYNDFRRRGIPEWLLRAELLRLFCASRGASSLVARSLLALLRLKAAAASTDEARGEREREGRIMNLQIAPSWMINILSMRADQIIHSTMTPSWMTNYNLDERKSDYQLAIHPS